MVGLTYDLDKKTKITWKKRSSKNKAIHAEEEIEINFDEKDYDNLISLLENVLHLKLVDSYERYRSVFENEDVEIVVDRFPFGIAFEIESKGNKNPNDTINYWLNKLNLKIEDAYKFSWDDRYFELCKEQNINVYSHVTFDKVMPKEYIKYEK